jgi:hypothetical protein
MKTGEGHQNDEKERQQGDWGARGKGSKIHDTGEHARHARGHRADVDARGQA